MRLLVSLAAVLLAQDPPPSTHPPRPAVEARTDPEACLPTSVMLPPDATGPAPASVALSFTVDGEGNARDVSIGFVAGAAVPYSLAQAAATAIEECTWVLPGGGATGPTARTVELRLAVIPFQKLQGPVTSPKMADPDCFRGAFRFQASWDKEIRIAFKFPVYPDGKAGRARSLTPFANPGDQRRMEEATTAAVKACEWIPGRDAAGAPTRIFVILPLRLQ